MHVVEKIFNLSLKAIGSIISKWLSSHSSCMAGNGHGRPLMTKFVSSSVAIVELNIAKRVSYFRMTRCTFENTKDIQISMKLNPRRNQWISPSSHVERRPCSSVILCQYRYFPLKLRLFPTFAYVVLLIDKCLKTRRWKPVFYPNPIALCGVGLHLSLQMLLWWIRSRSLVWWRLWGS